MISFFPQRDMTFQTSLPPEEVAAAMRKKIRTPSSPFLDLLEDSFMFGKGDKGVIGSVLDDGTFTFTLHHKALLQVRGKISWALDGGSVVTAFLRMHWLQRIFISIWAAFILFSGLLDPSDRSGSELFVMLIMISFMIFLPYKIFQIFARKEFAAWERFFADVLKA